MDHNVAGQPLKRQPSKRRQALILGVILIIGFSLLALSAEGIVRLRHWIKFGTLWGIEQTYTKDPGSGLRIPIPGGVFGPIQINSRGFRSPEIEVPKPPGTVRIAFLGASTTFCAEVSSNAMTWPHLVWKSLRQRWPDARIDYVNAGVSGYSVKSSVKNLAYRVRPLDPDVIVIYHATNDLSGNSFAQAAAQGIVQRQTEQDLTWPAKYSLLWYLVEKNLRVIYSKQKATESNGKIRLDIGVLKKPFERDLLELVKESQKIADFVVIITFSTRLRPDQSPDEQRAAAVTSLYYMPYMSIDDLLRGFAAYNDVIRDVATRTGAFLIEGENDIPGDARHFVDSVHFTDEGSRKMAERVAAALIKNPTLERIIAAKR